MPRIALTAAVGLAALVAAGSASSQSISVGQSVNGELTASDMTLDDGTHVDCYNLQTRAGQRLQIDQTAGLFDSLLMVVRGGCANPTEVIGQDDDGGGGLHARVVAQGDGDLWGVVVNSVEAGATGGYQLRVSVAPTDGAPSPTPTASRLPTLPRVESGWGVEPMVCHSVYRSMVALRAEGVAPDEYGNVRGIDYADRASRTRQGLTAGDLSRAETYVQNFQMMALVGATGAAPNGTPNGHRPLAEYLTVLGDGDRANRFTPVTAY